MQKKKSVLIAEDDLQLAFIIKDNLEEEGFIVINCPDGLTAWEEYQRVQPDICILDVNMPGKDGFALAKKIRQKSDVVPVLFLTAKAMDEDKLKGFETGADDYITKPFSMKELVSRMNVFLRRNSMMFQRPSEEYTIGNFKLQPGDNRLTVGQEEIGLTPKETDLLEFFCSHPNTILKREEILLHVWGKNDHFLGRSMDVFITRLRKILKGQPVSIETIHQQGYRLNV